MAEPEPAERILTWAGLLARWVEFARASVALPRDGSGGRWRASVAPAIELHAIAMALAEAGELPAAERALARDRAAFAAAQASRRLDAAWRGERLPDSLAEILAHARAAIERSAWLGARELVWPGPGPLEMPSVPEIESVVAAGRGEGTLCAMAPGTPAMPGEPVAWWVDRPDLALAGCIGRAVGVPRQVYRQLDAHGHALGDRIVPLDRELVSGLPLLVPLVEAGRPVGRWPMAAEAWREAQRRAIGDRVLPVIDESEPEA